MTKVKDDELEQTDSETISEVEVPISTEESEESRRSNSQEDGADSQNIEVTAAPGALDFKNPLLKGKTPEELERLFQMQQDAIAAQNNELNRLTTAGAPQPSAPTPAQPEDETDPYGDDFLAPRFRTLEKRVEATLSRMIEPLAKAQHAGEAQGVRGKLRGALKHFSVLEPHIDTLLREQKVDPTTASEGQLRMIYHTAVGLATEQGINLSSEPAAPVPATPTPTGEPPVNIPQHRPSAAPLPTPNAPPARRKLTEEERVLAKVYFPHAKDPEGEYLTLQNADENDIVQPGFSKEGW